MHASALTLGALLVAPALAAQPASNLEFHRQLAAGKRLYIQNIIGDINVTGTSGRNVEVTGNRVQRRYGNPEDVTMEVVELDNGVALCIRYPHNRSRWRNNNNDNGSDKKDKRASGAVSAQIYSVGIDKVLLREVLGGGQNVIDLAEKAFLEARIIVSAAK